MEGNVSVPAVLLVVVLIFLAALVFSPTTEHATSDITTPVEQHQPEESGDGH